MDRNKLKFWVDVGMGISFLIVTITGILKIPRIIYITKPFVSSFMSFTNFSRLHDLSGVIMAAFVLIHLILNWVWIKSMISCMFVKKEIKKQCKIR